MGCREFVDVAGELTVAKFSTPEARFRSAIGRAYYGAYHEACELATHLGATLYGNDHDQVVKALHQLAKDRGDDAFRQVGVMLKDLHAARRLADYIFSQHESKRFATSTFSVEQVADGMSILKRLDALRKKYPK